MVIGSGATAVTLVPELAKKAKHVIMLQRSPTYIVSMPAQDAIANKLRELLPARVAYSLTRWKNVSLGMLFFNLARRLPERTKKRIVGLVRQELGEGYDVEKHFTPSYNPWDQRLCLVPDADLFEAIREGAAEVVTDHIETFTDKGIKLRSGRELEADLVVTATGLKVQFLSGITLEVDGKPVVPSETMNYKNIMFNNVPNLASTFGYTNASWTLKADLTAEYVCRLLRHMDETGAKQCTPRLRDPEVSEEPFIDFSSGYIQRALAEMPRQGSKAPWRLRQNYVLDVLALRHGAIDDGTMEFTSSKRSAVASGVETSATREPATA